MRKIAYIVLFIGMVLGVINLTLTNSLATEGEFLKSTVGQKNEKEQELSSLRQSIMEVQGLGRIGERARELGISESAKFVR